VYRCAGGNQDGEFLSRLVRTMHEIDCSGLDFVNERQLVTDHAGGALCLAGLCPAAALGRLAVRVARGSGTQLGPWFVVTCAAGVALPGGPGFGGDGLGFVGVVTEHAGHDSGRCLQEHLA